MNDHLLRSVNLVGMLIIGMVIGAGGLVVLQSSIPKAMQSALPDMRQQTRRDATLTNPLLDCQDPTTPYSKSEWSDLDDQLTTFVQQQISAGKIMLGSVYFRDLNNGPWFGVNETQIFSPASLLKLPLAMSLYTIAQDNPSFLQNKIQYKTLNIPDSTQPYGDPNTLVDGKSYTTQELIDTMLLESSNEAAVTLANHMNMDSITSVYKDLGLPPPVAGEDYKINTHTYTSFFRVLYNATYLDRDQSEAILSILTKTTFKDGLVAGVPAGTTVAHKFGSRALDDSGKNLQLHDCGIVYAPKRPYALCVMTQGSDFPTMANVIKQISQQVYDNVSTSGSAH
jgi:beta-lactamase class A